MRTLRPVEASDADLLLAWVNQPDSLEFKLMTAGPIPRDDHLAWLATRLKDRRTLMFVIVEDRSPVGQVRLQATGSGQVAIDVFVEKGARGRGLAAFAVTEAMRAWSEGLGSATAEAVVKSNNQASQRLFASLGFSLIHEQNGIMTFQRAISRGEETENA